MNEEKTIYIRCTKQTSDLLDDIRKRKLPNLSRNAQVITLIHSEAERLGIVWDEDTAEQEGKDIYGGNYDQEVADTIEIAKKYKESIMETPITGGLSKLAETKTQASEDL
jgi:hypothetical protein|tara:strand:+ start:2541 stop:2870 length:330 start_codon:yes stop_codon:yes gene_type:complete